MLKILTFICNAFSPADISFMIMAEYFIFIMHL